MEYLIALVVAGLFLGLWVWRLNSSARKGLPKRAPAEVAPTGVQTLRQAPPDTFRGALVTDALTSPTLHKEMVAAGFANPLLRADIDLAKSAISMGMFLGAKSAREACSIAAARDVTDDEWRGIGLLWETAWAELSGTTASPASPTRGAR